MMNIQRFAAATGKFTNVRGTGKSLEADLTAVDATDGIVFDVKPYSNDRILLIFKNTHGSTAKDAKVLKPAAGKGGYAAADTDITVSSLAAGGVAAFWVETAKYASTDGKITCAGSSADIKVVAVVY